MKHCADRRSGTSVGWRSTPVHDPARLIAARRWRTASACDGDAAAILGLGDHARRPYRR
jgi:hypothetical protein